MHFVVEIGIDRDTGGSSSDAIFYEFAQPLIGLDITGQQIEGNFRFSATCRLAMYCLCLSKGEQRHAAARCRWASKIAELVDQVQSNDERCRGFLIASQQPDLGEVRSASPQFDVRNEFAQMLGVSPWRFRLRLVRDRLSSLSTIDSTTAGAGSGSGAAAPLVGVVHLRNYFAFAHILRVGFATHACGSRDPTLRFAGRQFGADLSVFAFFAFARSAVVICLGTS